MSLDLEGLRSQLGVTAQEPLAPEKSKKVEAPKVSFEVSKTYGTPSKLLDNLELAESSGNPTAVHKDTKALGAYQFMPETAAMLHDQGVKFNPFDKQEARAAADYYISQLASKHGGDYEKAMAEYGGFKTKDATPYVSKVMKDVGQSAQPNTMNIEGLKQALQKTPEAEVKQELKVEQEKKPFVNKTHENLVKSRQEMDQMFGNVPGYEQFKAASLGLGKNISDTAATIQQLVGKGVSLISPEAGKAITENATKNALKTQAMVAPSEQANPISSAVGNVAGAVLNPINKVIPGGGATGLIGKLAEGGAQGALSNVLTTPVTDENKSFLIEKIKQAGVGGAGGALGTAITGVATKIAQPIENALGKIGNEAVDVLRKAGVPLDVAQATGSQFLQRTKASLSDNPVTAGAQAEFAAKQKSAYNQAIAKTMGEDATAITPDVIQNAKNRLGEVYDNLFEKHGSKISGKVYKDLANIRDESLAVLPASEQNVIKNIVKDIIDKASENRSVLTGAQYQAQKKILDRLTAQNSNISPYAKEIKETLLSGLKNSIKDEGDIALLKQTNKQYGNMKKIEDVVSSDVEGNISPSKLSNSLATKSKRNALYAEDRELANLARAGKLILENKVPNSGTASRILAAALPGAIGGIGYGLYQGDLQGAGLGALAGIAYPKGMQYLMNTPSTKSYLEKGLKPGLLRSVAEAPGQIGQALPQYAQKPGVASAATLANLINLRNQGQ
jgi:hypothetical protein